MGTVGNSTGLETIQMTPVVERHTPVKTADRQICVHTHKSHAQRKARQNLYNITLFAKVQNGQHLAIGCLANTHAQENFNQDELRSTAAPGGCSLTLRGLLRGVHSAVTWAELRERLH